MDLTLRGRHMLAALLALTAGIGVPVGAATAPDSTLFTTYSVDSGLASVSWIVCGSTTQTEGCYSSGSLGPFGHVGALLESRPVTSGDTVTREIYVLDVATGSAADGVSLFVYLKKDVVTALYDTTTVSLDREISLPLVGGNTVTASMAANNSYLYVGTNQSTQAVSVEKRKWIVTLVGGFSPPLPVAAITADSYGNVTVTFGAPGGEFSGFYVFGPTGGELEGGGGSQFMLDDFNAVIPAALPF